MPTVSKLEYSCSLRDKDLIPLPPSLKNGKTPTWNYSSLACTLDISRILNLDTIPESIHLV
jgi:hypothetical protein